MLGPSAASPSLKTNFQPSRNLWWSGSGMWPGSTLFCCTKLTSHSDVVSNVTHGRAICRLASMFENVEDLVEENDRRLSLEDTDDDLLPFTLQWALYTFHFTSRLLILIKGKSYLSGICAPLEKHTPYEKEFTPAGVLWTSTFLPRGNFFYSNIFDPTQNIIYSFERVRMVPVVTMLLTWSRLLWIGWQHSSKALNHRNYFHPQRNQIVASSMKIPVVYCVQLITTGTTLGKLTLILIGQGSVIFCHYSVRKNIREGHPEFVITADSWPAFLYPHAGSHNNGDVEQGLFRSAILLKVYQYPALQILLLTMSTSGLQIHLHITNICARHRLRKGCRWSSTSTKETY